MSDKTRQSIRGWLLLALLLFLPAGLAACTEEKIFENPDFDEPTETVNNFLGYVGDPADKQTSCGNCHATFQGGWASTSHADAWDALQSSGHAQDFCEGCHTISELGNLLTEPAGYKLQPDARYTDVQCESCHGSGWEHVNDPNVATAPLGSIVAGTEATVGCGECHSGTHHPFVEQWQESEHSKVGFASGRDGCNSCHEGRTAMVQKFFETSNYLEKDGEEDMAIVCAVCHDPHGTDFERNLRAPIKMLGAAGQLPSTEHLCYRCHSRRGTPPSTHGPHSAQGPLVIQEDVGWLPQGFEIPQQHPHGNPQINPEICVTCHVVDFTVTDPATGDFEFQSVGHTFLAISCLDPVTGIPVTGDCDVSERDFSACAACHTDVANAEQKYLDTKDDINSLLDQLWFDTDNNHVMDATDAGVLPMVVALGDTVELDPSDDIITVAEGAFWNGQLGYTSDREYWGDLEVFGIHVSAHKASGDGVHNPTFLEDLLEASIQAVIDFYGLTP